jgi:hypothetical protein
MISSKIVATYTDPNFPRYSAETSLALLRGLAAHIHALTAVSIKEGAVIRKALLDGEVLSQKLRKIMECGV